MSKREKGSCAAVWRGWYAMSTFFLALALFLHALGLGSDLRPSRRNRAAQVRRLVSESCSSPSALAFVAIFGFSSLTGGTSLLQRIRSEAQGARACSSPQSLKVGHRRRLGTCPINAKRLFPCFDALFRASVITHFALPRSANHGHAAVDPNLGCHAATFCNIPLVA